MSVCQNLVTKSQILLCIKFPQPRTIHSSQGELKILSTQLKSAKKEHFRVCQNSFNLAYLGFSVVIGQLVI